MKTIISLTGFFLSVLSFFSCSKIEQTFQTEDKGIISIETKASDNPRVKLTYWEKHDIIPSKIREFQDSDEKLAFCQIDSLSALSTDELVEACYNYPLAFDALLCNDERFGARFIVENFNGYQELLTRSDAAVKLISFYENLNSLSASEQLRDVVFERVLASDNIFNKFNEHDITNLQNIILRKSVNRASTLNKISGHTSLDDLSNKVFKTTPSGWRSSYVTRYTPFGQSFTCLDRGEELTDADKLAMDNYIANNYSNITKLASATTMYNCHAYAWLSSFNVWVNDDSNNDGFGDVIPMFTTNDLYTQVQQGPNYIIHYYLGDHSAVRHYLDNPIYTSKWGSYGLYRHSPTNVPTVYNSSYRNVYSAPIITGEEFFDRNEIYEYEVTPYMSYATYEWLVDQDEERYEIISQNSNILQIKFLRSVIFDIYCNIKTQSGNTAYTASFEALPN